MKNVLVFPCGSELGLEVNRALADSRHFTLFGASSVDDHGRYVYKNYIAGLSFIDSADFIGELNKVVEQYGIDFIIPAHDGAVLKMAENQDKIKAVVITSCRQTCRVCRSKGKTYEVFEKLIPTPRVYTVAEEMTFPVFLKPDTGQGTKGTHKATTKEAVDFYLRQDPTLLVLEYLPGKEYTVDCFTDRNGILRFAAGRQRTRIYNGISVNSRQVQDARFQEIAAIINETLSFQGAWFYQVKERTNGELVLMEIAPRIAGTMALFRVDGVNFVQLSLFDRMGLEATILCNRLDMEIDRALFARFSPGIDYSCVYVDFDDTIIVNNSVNTNIMKFLYQSRNMGKKIVVISKHKHDVKETLRKFAISELLFDEIILLNESEHKSDYITEMNSVFIDDSFAERKAVHDKLHIPVFALDAVEALLSWTV
ncbi:MAG: ATP-grasp domain-containing protein [Nitrospirae bacterium]|uniref:ATP-grasp domain-containing protein n=1 Tax=Candidatus Magnetobacterium casense TaxID=1455061 RepID=UPI00059142F5|nr:ATP-grasp domain-containing protein [Candidatus Magnetobacterium casensis]MBF0336646.1 ATP-grasp domain-containing protein [Nitrospirota bacterium]